MNLKRLYFISSLIMVAVTATQVITYTALYKRDTDVDPDWV